MITYGSVCSGIEAASVAWHPLGWEPEWFAEIEKFPCSVLAHHYPDIPNLGDMTTIAAKIRSGLVRAPDILVGGTPCQAFSIAGLRNSMGDARGQLSLSFVDLANAIDAMRTVPAITVWENVPGVLSTKDNAFGCFLAGLAGEDDPLVTPGGKWPNAGCVYGPRRTIAWRVLDAQYFGVAQRRRRVFVVASARDGFDPAAVLFEFDGVRRDIVPRREPRQEITGTLGARASSGGGFSTDFECAGGIQPVVAVCPTAAYSVALRGRDGGATAELGDEVATCLRASGGGGDKAHVLAPIICMAHGQGGAEIRHDSCPTLTCNHEAPIAAYAIQAGALRINPQSGPDGLDASEDGTGRGQPIVSVSAANAEYNKGFIQGASNASPQEADTGEILRRVRQEIGEEAFAQWGLGILDSLQQKEILQRAMHGLDIRKAAFSRSWVVCCALGSPFSSSEGAVQSLLEAGCDRCSSQGSRSFEQFTEQLGAYLSKLSRQGAQAERFMLDLWEAAEGIRVLQYALLAAQEIRRPTDDKGQSVRTDTSGGGEAYGEGVQGSRLPEQVPCERVLRETCAASESRKVNCAVRRLTVPECEFLQGFPRGYLGHVLYRGKPPADGPRYRALGNSMAVPVMAFIGRRIQAAIQPSQE